MTENSAPNSHVLQNSNSKTVSLTFHLYPRHYKEFIEICEKLEKFHSEVLRQLVIDFINTHREQPKKDESQKEESDALGKFLKGDFTLD